MRTGFDFTNTGAGSAGCVLADRLSAHGCYAHGCYAHGCYQVLSLQAGGSDAGSRIKLPVGNDVTFSDPIVNWCSQAEPNPGLVARGAEMLLEDNRDMAQAAQ